MISLPLDKESENMRFDRFLRKHLRNASLSMIYKFIREGICKVNDKKATPDTHLTQRDLLTLHLSPEVYATLTAAKPQILAKKTFTVLSEDDDILIVNKPPYLASQPGTGVERNNLTNQVKTYLRNLSTKPATANRLDRGTSGIVLVGKHRQAIMALYKIFEEREIEKYYLALVKGRMVKKGGTLTTHLKRVTEKFQHKMLVRPEREKGTVTAESMYRVLQQNENYALVEVRITTGKMHQIRVQFAHLGHPVVGDKIYGDKTTNEFFKKILRRQFLHAYRVRFEHPFTKKIIDVVAPLPEDLKAALKKINLTFSEKNN